MPAAISLLFAMDASANLTGTWIQHPAATLRSANKESQVDRIIDGKKYVYFSVRGGAFNRNNTDSFYSIVEGIDLLTLFRYDKSVPWGEGCIRPVAQEVELEEAFHQTLNYSPRHEVLAVAFPDGAVDFIYDDGNIIKSTALVGTSGPGRLATPYSITFDDEKPVVYMAGNYGVATINITNGELESIRSFQSPVAFAARVGDNMVVVAGDISPTVYSTSTYVFPLNETPSTLSSPIAGGSNLQVIMPLTDNSFAALARGTADTQNILTLFTIEEDEIKSETLVTAKAVDNGAASNFRHLFRTDGFVSATEDGYAIQNNTEINLLKKGVDRDQLLSTISKSDLSATEKNAKAATIDGKVIWFYAYGSGGLDASERGFYSRNYSDGKWDEPIETVTPSGPFVSYPAAGEWNEKYGLIFRGPGSDFGELHHSYEDDYIFSYKDGKWSDLSYNALNPKYRALTMHAKSVTSEPANPDMVWGLSHKNGLFRMDLSDPDNFLMLGTTNLNASYETSNPGFFRFFQSQNAFKELINGSNIDFDSEGSMWFARYWISVLNNPDSEYEEISYAKVPLYYYTAEELEKLAHIGGDRSKFIEPHVIEVPYACSQQKSSLCALKHENNKNIIAFTPYFRPVYAFRPFLLDHNGTPDFPDDDRIVYLEGMYDENGDKFMTDWFRAFYEDPANGDLWFLTKAGPFILNPQEALNGNLVGHRLKVTRRNGMEVTDYPLEQVSITGIDSDFLGRKWIATEVGLFCLSKDGEELLGHYTRANSPIPSDNVLNVVCSPEGAVFALTSHGIAEFHPEGSLVPVSGDSQLSIWPTSVAPDYNGYVTVSGVENNREYILVDNDGNMVVSLGTTGNNTLQWDLRNAENQRVKAGRYNIKRKDTEEIHPIIIL